MTPALNLEELTLDSGSHQPGDGQMCVMEAAAFMAGEPWSDHPACVSPVIGAFLRSWNDTLPTADRNQLKRYLCNVHDGGVLGTAPASLELENRRSWLAVDWSVRVHTPAWLRLAGLDDQAETLEGLPEILNPTTAAAIKPALDAVRKDARAAWDAAWDAAGDAAWAAAWAAARDAARDAARAAARDAARAAAGAAAWAAARAAARDAARDAAGAAAWAAAGAAARERLAPTAHELRAEAHRLVDRMLAVTE